MQTLLVWFAALLAVPFWEAKPAREWSDEELKRILEDSPWSQTSDFQDKAVLSIYLATAKPLREAEAELVRRYSAQTAAANPPPSREDTALSEYETFLSASQGKVIVVAIRNANPHALAIGEEAKRMEQESYMRAGRSKVKLTGHFLPAVSDPVLRLVFSRPETEVKDLRFELYIPGVTGPYRQVTFRTKDLFYKGRPEM